MGNSCSRVSSNANSAESPAERPAVKEIVKVDSELPSNLLASFTYNELKKFTQNFSCFLGGGGFGDVYKGVIPEDQSKGLRSLRVAVKIHDAHNSRQGVKEWVAEVKILGQLSHPNLVKLIGYCCEDNHQVLVYEFMCRGSVETNLYAKRLPPLPWATRMKIAFGAAKGLAFLHEEQIIYRDVKTSNVLLDWDYNVKLSDFGLAKNGPVGDQTHVSTEVMGTYGYADPEYMRTGHLTASSDVYSFGVVLLELITGRRSLEKNHKDPDQVLAEWAPPRVRNIKKLPSIVDPRLDGDYSITSVRKAAMLACHCLDRDPKARPLMQDVVDTLEPLQIRPADNFNEWQYMNRN